MSDTRVPAERSAARRTIVWLAVVLVVTAAATLHAQQKFDEREIKATYLFNFAQFVDWPDSAFADAQAPLIIGILADEPLGAILDTVVSGEVVKDRALTVARFRTLQDVTICHILFIGQSEKANYARVIETLGGHPMLTVGDADGFIDSGGMVRFVVAEGRIRLRINLPAARASSLTLSSGLLRAAEVIGGPGR